MQINFEYKTKMYINRPIQTVKTVPFVISNITKMDLSQSTYRKEHAIYKQETKSLPNYFFKVKALHLQSNVI